MEDGAFASHGDEGTLIQPSVSLGADLGDERRERAFVGLAVEFLSSGKRTLLWNERRKEKPQNSDEVPRGMNTRAMFSPLSDCLPFVGSKRCLKKEGACLHTPHHRHR